MKNLVELSSEDFMEKIKSTRNSLGIRKSKRRDKKLIKKVVDFLKSDYYMFAPLVSLPPSDIGGPKITSTTGVKISEPRKSERLRMFHKLGEYLKSDPHMYATIVAPRRRTPPPEGKLQYRSRVTREVSINTLLTETEQQAFQSPNYRREDMHSSSKQQALGHEGLSGPVLYQKCHASSASGDGALEGKLRRRVAID